MAAKTTLVCCLISLCLVFKANTVSADCPPGWFGNNCEYQCHCEGRCSPEGKCEFGCSKGWFGPACQYVDLVYTESTRSAHQFLLDGDDNTCYSLLSDPTTVTLKEPFPFTWLRLHVKKPIALDYLQVRLRDQNGADVPCDGRKIAMVDADKTTVDVHCNTRRKIQHVILYGKGLRYLCSIYISGGRNLALWQYAWQSSRPYSYVTPSQAVDGNTDTCILTSVGDSQPRLKVYFSRNKAVNRYVLYNIPIPQWLQGFSLTSYRYGGAQVLNYVDRSQGPQAVYTVTTDTILPVAFMEVEARLDMGGTKILGLCELQIYGDSLCLRGTYGRDCEHWCDCGESTESCLVSTGACPSLCAEGLTERSCR